MRTFTLPHYLLCNAYVIVMHVRKRRIMVWLWSIGDDDRRRRTSSPSELCMQGVLGSNDVSLALRQQAFIYYPVKYIFARVYDLFIAWKEQTCNSSCTWACLAGTLLLPAKELSRHQRRQLSLQPISSTNLALPPLHFFAAYPSLSNDYTRHLRPWNKMALTASANSRPPPTTSAPWSRSKPRLMLTVVTG